MHSERKRTGCPTLLFCSFPFLCSISHSLFRSFLFNVPSLTQFFTLSFFMFHLSLLCLLFPFLCSISHSLLPSFLFYVPSLTPFLALSFFYVPPLTPFFALSFFMFHLSLPLSLFPFLCSISRVVIFLFIPLLSLSFQNTFTLLVW